MPAWVPVIGAKKSAEVVAFLLSHHAEGEPIEVQAAWIPILPQ
jgi:cytochrome c oxidase cbb3-type subunit 3